MLAPWLANLLRAEGMAVGENFKVGEMGRGKRDREREHVCVCVKGKGREIMIRRKVEERRRKKKTFKKR